MCRSQVERTRTYGRPSARARRRVMTKKRFGAGAGHDAIEQTNRIRDQPRVQIFLQCQLLLEHRVRIAEGVVALSHADLAEVLARRAVGAHVVRSEKCKAGVRSAGPVREHGIAREHAEAAETLAERVDVVGVGADAGDHIGIAGLDRAQRAAHRHDAAGAAERDMIQPSDGDAEVLGQPDRRVGRQHEAAETQAVDLAFGRVPTP